MAMPISVYSSAFNLIQNKFDYKTFLNKVLMFATEVVICVNKSNDNTKGAILEYADSIDLIDKLFVIDADISYEDPLLDGKLKNLALQSTNCPLKFQLDIDEFVPASVLLPLKNISEQFGNTPPEVKALMLPVVDLFGDYDKCKGVNQKWYLHKTGLFRGPVNFARLPNGRVDINKSDTCELIDENGNLVPSIPLIDPALNIFDKLHILKTGKIPYVVHTGYLNLDERLHRNKVFWQKHWKTESGREDVFIPMKLEDFKENAVLHRLKI